MSNRRPSRICLAETLVDLWAPTLDELRAGFDMTDWYDDEHGDPGFIQPADTSLPLDEGILIVRHDDQPLNTDWVDGDFVACWPVKFHRHMEIGGIQLIAAAITDEPALRATVTTTKRR